METIQVINAGLKYINIHFTPSNTSIFHASLITLKTKSTFKIASAADIDMYRKGVSRGSIDELDLASVDEKLEVL